MNRIIRKTTAAILATLICFSLSLCTMSSSAAAAENSRPVAYDNISIGAGASFYAPLINPTDSNNYVVLSDMNDIYFSLDGGQSWDRSETMTNFLHACFSDDGTLFVGGACLYASSDKGQTIRAIYPREEDILARSSRNGRNNVVFLVEGDYDSGYITCLDTFGDRVYFVTLDWTDARTFQLLSCKADGSDLVQHMVCDTYLSAYPSDVTHQLLCTDAGLYFSNGTVLYFYEFSSGHMLPVYHADGQIRDVCKIEEELFILDDTDEKTRILHTKDLITFQDLSDFNTLPNTFQHNGSTQTFQWHFRAISGNSRDAIFLSFTSPVSWIGMSTSDLGGVMKFDGQQFHWVFDPIFRNRGEYDLEGWSFGSYHPINGICIDPNDDDHCIMANIDTVYDIRFGEEVQDVQYLHCTTTKSGGKTTYTSTGLNAQATTFVRTDPFNPQHLLIGTSDIGLQISMDGGESFCQMKVNPNYTSAYNTCYDVYFDQNTPGLVYGLWSSRHDAPYIPRPTDANARGYFGISRDGGITWDFTYSTGMPENSIPIRMSVQPSEDGLSFAVATFNNGFFISHDSGKTFTSISDQMDNCNGLIWGQDVALTPDSIYCLTAWHTLGGSTPSVLYRVDRETGSTTTVDLGSVVNARSLTWDETYGLYLNAIHNTTWGWRKDLQARFDVNTDGGVYQVKEDNTLTYLLDIELGASSSGFTPDGTMYVVADKGKVYVRAPGEKDFSLYVSGLFTRMQNITFSPSGTTLYITTLGGGTYRMPTKTSSQPEMSPSSPPTENTIYTVTFLNETGETLSVQQVPWGSAAAEPKLPYRPSDDLYCYRFIGWDADTSFVVQDMTVTAQFEARAHTPVTHYQRAATCTTTGHTGNQYCQYCGKLMSTGRALPKLSHQPTANSNQDGTHTISCCLCQVVLRTETCDTHNGQCAACGYSPVSQKFTKATSFAKGKTYLITFNGYAFGQSMTPQAISLSANGSTYRPSQNVPEHMLWTYNGTCLYTVFNGTTYYLSIASSNGKLVPAVTSSRSWAFEWLMMDHSLAVVITRGYCNIGNVYNYMNISPTGLSLSATPTGATIYLLQS